MRSSHKEKWVQHRFSSGYMYFVGERCGPPQGSSDILTMNLIKQGSQHLFYGCWFEGTRRLRRPFEEAESRARSTSVLSDERVELNDGLYVMVLVYSSHGGRLQPHVLMFIHTDRLSDSGIRNNSCGSRFTWIQVVKRRKEIFWDQSVSPFCGPRRAVCLIQIWALYI